MDDFDGVYDASIITRVEEICLQIDNLYNEWDIVSASNLPELSAPQGQ